MDRRGLEYDSVTDAAVAIADADGLEAVTVARVAKQLGVRAPSIYNHVDGRCGLQRAVALRGLAALSETLQRSAVGRSGPDAIRQMSSAYREFAQARPGSYMATQRAPGAGDPEHLAATARVKDVFIDVLRGFEIDGDEAIHVTRGLRSALHGFIVLEQNQGFGIDLDIDDSYVRLVETQIAGIERAPAAGKTSRRAAG
jgi:AcrR family transcriptional regulator